MLHIAGAVKALGRGSAEHIGNTLVFSCTANDFLAINLGDALLGKGLPGQLLIGCIIQLTVRLQLVLLLEAFQRAAGSLRHASAGAFVTEAQHLQLLLCHLQAPVALLHLHLGLFFLIFFRLFSSGFLLLFLRLCLLGRLHFGSRLGCGITFDGSRLRHRLHRLRLAYGRRRCHRCLMRFVADNRRCSLCLPWQAAGQHDYGQHGSQLLFHLHQPRSNAKLKINRSYIRPNFSACSAEQYCNQYRAAAFACHAAALLPAERSSIHGYCGKGSACPQVNLYFLLSASARASVLPVKAD